MRMVTKAARQITGADGATFVLRQGTECFYGDEDAIGPLWKGRRFPATSCISGWVMMNGKPAAVENVFDDPRIPVNVYEKTFVHSLAMVPVREIAPLAAIGIYWATTHRALDAELKRLELLAHHTSAAIAMVGTSPALSQANGAAL